MKSTVIALRGVLTSATKTKVILQVVCCKEEDTQTRPFFWQCAWYEATDQLKCVVSQLVLVAHVDFDQQRAVCGDGAEGQVTQLLAAVGCVFQQARRL